MSVENIEMKLKENENEKDASKSSDPLQEAMGNFGPWHALIVVSLSLVKFSVAWHQLSIVFLAPDTNFNCDHNNNENNYTDNTESEKYSMECEIRVGNHSEECNKFKYDTSIFKDSIITQWDLVCAKQPLANIVQTVTMFGVLLGNMVFGIIADRIGRKLPLVLAVLLQSVTGLASAFAPWYSLFLVLKFISALATGGAMLTSFVLIMEIVGVKWRPICSVLFHVPFIVGQIISPLISYLTRTWSGYQIAVSLPPILLLSYYWIIPESPRWLLAVGRVDEAEKILEIAAKKNKISSEKVGLAIEAHKILSTNSKEAENSTKTYNITHLFKTPNLRIKTICICVNWLTCGICFFGLAQYVSKLGGDIFVNTAVSAAMELPGTFMVFYLISRVSRLKILIGGNLLSGISLLLLTTTNNEIAAVSLATLGLAGMSISFPTVYLYSTEVFPTVVRNVGLGLASLFARSGSMVAPFIADLKSVQSWLPPLLFCIGPLLGAGLCLLLPETMNCDLPETIEDGENFGKKKRSSEIND